MIVFPGCLVMEFDVDNVMSILVNNFYDSYIIESYVSGSGRVTGIGHLRLQRYLLLYWNGDAPGWKTGCAFVTLTNNI